jgi:hypothetical protein
MLRSGETLSHNLQTCISRSSKTVKSPALTGLGGLSGASTPDPLGSAGTEPPSPQTSLVHKSNRPERCFSLTSDGFPSSVQLYNCMRGWRRTTFPTYGRRCCAVAPTGPPSRREGGSGSVGLPGSAASPASEQPGPRAERQSARAPTRPAGSGGLPPTRKTDRAGRPSVGPQRGADAVRCGLHSTLVRTTQETRTLPDTGFAPYIAAEVRGASASWQRAVTSHPTDAARCTR